MSSNRPDVDFRIRYSVTRGTFQIHWWGRNGGGDSDGYKVLGSEFKDSQLFERVVLSHLGRTRPFKVKEAQRQFERAQRVAAVYRQPQLSLEGEVRDDLHADSPGQGQS